MKSRGLSATFAKMVVAILSVVITMIVAPAPAQAAGEPMRLVFAVNAGDTINLPLLGSVNATVDWNDSNVENVTSAGWKSHTYSTAGNYTVSITGTVTQFGAGDNYSWSFQKLTDVLDFGDIGLTSLSGAFSVATDLQSLPSNIPASVTDTSFMFRSAWHMNVAAISSWDMSHVTNARFMFWDAQDFNQPLNSWDVSNVTTMQNMFDHAWAFNQPLNNWDTSNVTNMAGMFAYTLNFNQSLNGWDTHNVTDMSAMFYGTRDFNSAVDLLDTSSVTTFDRTFNVTQSFNQPLNSWDVSSATNFDHMFQGAQAFNQPLDQWDTSSMVSAQEMLNQTPVFNGDISTWDVSRLENAWGMLANTDAFNGDISSWNTSRVTGMGYMFYSAHAFNQDIGSWNTSRVTDMAGTFAYANHFNQDISSWDLSNVTSTMSMFENAGDFNQDISSWDVSNVNNMFNMFYGTQYFNQDLSAWDTSNVRNMAGMFGGAVAFNQPLVSTPGGWNTSAVVTMRGMFNGAAAFNQSVTSWDTSSLEDASGMFAACSYDQPMPTTPGGWNTSNVTNMSLMFGSNHVFNQDLSSWDVSHVQNFEAMFEAALLFDGDVSTWDVSSGTNFNRMFRVAEKFNQDLSNWDMSSAIYLSYMFNYAYLFNQPLNDWDVSNVQYVDTMFASTRDFNQPLNNWDTSNFRNMAGMFSSTANFNQPLNSWDTSNVTNMAGMFTGAQAFNQSLNDWDTSQVSDMNAMFYGATSFDGDIHSWDTGNVHDMSNMFAGSVFNQPIGDWNTSNVSNMTSMFYANREFNQPLDKWDTHNVGFLNSMFTLATSFNQPIGTWDLSGAIQMGAMFSGATSFNQDLSDWRFPHVYYFGDMFANTAMSDANYSAFIRSIDAQPHMQNMTLSASAHFLCSAATARANLQATDNWWFNDLGAADCRTEQTITFPAISDTSWNKSLLLTATASSGLPVQYLWISGPCRVEADVVTALASGVCVVAAQQPGNAQYEDAMQVLRTINITDEGAPTVVYSGNGATSGTAPIDPVLAYWPGASAEVAAPGTLERAGWNFVGWNTKVDGSGDAYNAGDHVVVGARDVVLFAQWEQQTPHMLGFAANGANGDAPLGESHSQGESVSLPSGSGMSLDGYRFIGWNTSPDGQGTLYQPGDAFIMPGETVTLFATWQLIGVTNFSLIADGSSWTGGAARDIEYGTSITLPTASEVTKPGYVLGGWSRTPTGTVDFAPGATYVVDGNSSALYAVWQSTQRTSIKKSMSIKFWPYMSLLSLTSMKAIRNFAKKYLKTKQSGLRITVYGYVQHTAKGKKIPTPVVAFNESLQRARAKAVIAYLKTLGIRAKYKALIAESNSTVAQARRATIVATWRR